MLPVLPSRALCALLCVLLIAHVLRGEVEQPGQSPVQPEEEVVGKFDAPELTPEMVWDMLEAPNYRAQPEFQAMLAAWRKLSAEVGSGAKFQLLEGLAHPEREKELLVQQLRAGRHVTVGGQHFWRKPLGLPAVEARLLWNLLAAPTAEMTYLPDAIKGCCGFHADWLLTWRSRRATMHVLICFGCTKVMILRGRESKELLFAHLGRAATPRLKSLLERHRRSPSQAP